MNVGTPQTVCSADGGLVLLADRVEGAARGDSLEDGVGVDAAGRSSTSREHVAAH